MNRTTLNRLIKKNNSIIEGIGLETKSTSSPILSPLSKEEDPRVKKLKKELEKIDISNKPKYIKFNMK